MVTAPARLGKECPNPGQDHPGDHSFEPRRQHQRQADSCKTKTAPHCGPWPKPGSHLSRQRCREKGRGEDEINETHRHHANRYRWPDEHEIDVSENPDEGEEYAEADREGGAQAATAEMHCKHM